jgi:peroxiredoxin
MKKLLLSVSVTFIALVLNAQDSPRGLSLNDIAPDFAAVDQQGNRLHLKELLKKGPVVLVFYRGYWCPHCNKHLKRLEDSLSFISKHGASLVAISPEQKAAVTKTIEKTDVRFPVISDSSLTIMKKYDVAFPVSAQTVEKYKSYGIDFNVINGSENGTNLPVPAVYIIDQTGRIRYRFFDKDYTKRPSVAEIIANLTN